MKDKVLEQYRNYLQIKKSVEFFNQTCEEIEDKTIFYSCKISDAITVLNAGLEILSAAVLYNNIVNEASFEELQKIRDDFTNEN